MRTEGPSGEAEGLHRSDGFHAYTVATTSRAKALAAWGVTRDLFKDRDAAELTTGADYDTALAQPGETVRRG